MIIKRLNRLGRSKIGKQKVLVIYNRDTGEVEGYYYWQPHGVIYTDLPDHLKPKVLDAASPPVSNTTNAN